MCKRVPMSVSMVAHLRANALRALIALWSLSSARQLPHLFMLQVMSSWLISDWQKKGLETQSVVLTLCVAHLNTCRPRFLTSMGMAWQATGGTWEWSCSKCSQGFRLGIPLTVKSSLSESDEPSPAELSRSDGPS